MTAPLFSLSLQAKLEFEKERNETAAREPLFVETIGLLNIYIVVYIHYTIYIYINVACVYSTHAKPIVQQQLSLPPFCFDLFLYLFGAPLSYHQLIRSTERQR